MRRLNIDPQTKSTHNGYRDQALGLRVHFIDLSKIFIET